MASYIPQRGDVVWINLNPQRGHEQAGRRPGVVISPLSYNGKVGLAIFCPVTSHIKGYPYEVIIPDGCKIKGAILCDQIKSLDWQAREVDFIDRLPANIVQEILEKIGTLLQ